MEVARQTGIALRTLQHAARGGALHTETTIRGYVTTPEWLAQWQAIRRHARSQIAAS
ncbi:MAG TPA: hypothetical protein VIU62_16090 [Chloroflexota bacterium]